MIGLFINLILVILRLVQTQLMRRYEREIHFSQEEMEKIKAPFAQYSEDGCMTVDQFKKSMGLLGVGDAEYLSNRIFKLITTISYCTFEEFIEFLDKINNGSFEEKAQLSFNYLDRQRKGFIDYDDIEIIISEISFVWNFLTGEKISTAKSIELICLKLGISEHKSINFQEYLGKYEQTFNWYDFFNNMPNLAAHDNSKQYYTSVRNSNNEFKIDQIEEYIKLLHNQIQGLLYEFKEEESVDNYEAKSIFQDMASAKGPNYISAQEFQLKGDQEYNFRDSVPYLSQQQLEKQIVKEGDNIYEVIANKLEQLSEISAKLFSNKQAGQVDSLRPSRKSFIEQEKKQTLLNITRPTNKRRNIIYFGHQNWNLMLNMMLGIRLSLKSHYYKFNEDIEFTEEDIHCKYYHELIYKRNDKSIKQISEIFVDYSPKIFYYIRKYFNIDNNQFLKSLGLENLIGNLLMGKLSTLSDQTSQGKSGSFIYYTEDSKIIVKSISRQQYKKLREIVQSYVTYIKNNPDTYLMRIYGLYKMKNKSSNRQIYFMVIGNVFDREVEIDERYDIKGATHNRQTLPNEGDLLSHAIFNKNIALKDMDLIHNHNRTFDINISLKEKIFKQILRDAEFLKAHDIIQYSLLIGVHNTTANDFVQRREISLFPKQKNRSRQVMSSNKKEIYFFGIIDILSEYTTKKVFQNTFLGMFNDISCKNPEEYYDRFKSFIYKYVFSC